MRRLYDRVPWRRLALLTLSGTFFLGGCDPELRATVENGIINLSTSLLTAFLQAFIQLASEASQQTACILSDLAPPLA
jgi:hypothetical protein